MNGQRARGWPYVVTGTAFAGICAWISYNDGLFVARMAGNAGSIAFFYPLLPDGLIVLCLLALAEAARAGIKRSRWAVAGLLLGIGLTLAMNVGAGVAHTALDAVIDGFVPVVFFIAAEVVLWHVRRGRVPAEDVAGGTPNGKGPVGSPATQPVTAAVTPGVTVPTIEEIRGRRNCSPQTAQKIQAEVRRVIRSLPGTPERSRGGGVHGTVPAVMNVPAGMPPQVAAPVPAGTSNGQVRHA